MMSEKKDYDAQDEEVVDGEKYLSKGSNKGENSLDICSYNSQSPLKSYKALDDNKSRAFEKGNA